MKPQSLAMMAAAFSPQPPSDPGWPSWHIWVVPTATSPDAHAVLAEAMVMRLHRMVLMIIWGYMLASVFGTLGVVHVLSVNALVN